MVCMTKIARTSEVRAGFIGGGFMADVHAAAARAAGARVVGVASRTAASASAAQVRIGAEQAFGTVDHMLSSGEVDVVHICTPNATHAELSAAVLRAGTHVVCEKPLATNLDEAHVLTELAESSGLVAAVPFVYRFHPMVRETRALVTDGTIGRLFSIQGRYLQDWLASESDDDWRVDASAGGPSRAFADIGSHLCDVIEFVTGDPVARLCARVRTVHQRRSRHTAIVTEDIAAVLFETEAGVPGTLHVSQVAAGYKNGLAFELSGADRTIAFDQENPDLLRVGSREGFLSRMRGADMSPEASQYSRTPPGHVQGYQDAFNAFVTDVYQAIDGVAPDGLPRFADGLRAAQLTAAVLASQRTGGWVETGSGQLQAIA